MVLLISRLKNINELKIVCPNCASDVFYKYGKTKTREQRYKCLLCGKQFSIHAKRSEAKGKPECPNCNKKMNLYKIERDLIILRCSGYPDCKTYKKFLIKEVD